MTSWHDRSPCTSCGAAGARTHIGDQVRCNPGTEDVEGRPALAGTEVRGRIEGDESGPDEPGPTVWIDGSPISWTTLGEMMESFEGWQFHLRLDG